MFACGCRPSPSLTPGGGTNIAAAIVARSLPDGYTFLISGSSTHSANPWLFSKLPYDPEKDFRDVGGNGGCEGGVVGDDGMAIYCQL